MKRAIMGLWLATAAGGCNDEGRAPGLFDEGDPCHTNLQAECHGDRKLQHCVERQWVVSSCAEECRALSTAAVDGACVVSPYGIDHCECVYADPEGCTPGELACEDEDSLRECDETQRWVTRSCEELCEPVGVSLGCRDVSEDADERSPPAACLCGR